jgi:murein DD-endopeptidase MepM/ murein hydrolase activator NlpD
LLALRRPSFLPASELTPQLHRHIGFLNANRRALAIGAVAASGLLTSIPSLPASAEVVQAELQPTIVMQSFTAPSIVAAPVMRDGFGISSYSVVQWPVPAGTPISSGFGYRDCDGCSTDHTGIDFNPGAGYPIAAIADGVVTAAGWDSTGYGYMVTVQHVIDGQTVSTLYAHMQDALVAVYAGQQVSRGQQLGLVGDTGVSTGPHLHFSVILDGVMIEPYSWLLAHVNI